VRRRDVIGLIGGAAAFPRLLRAQQADKVTTIGFLSTGGPPNPASLAAFRKGLNETGFINGQNLAIEIRGAERYEQLAPFAADLVHREVAVIFAWGSANSALAAKAATSATPIVFVNGSDPVKSGIVDNINRPGGNVTGVSYYNSGIVAKRLELLSKLAPSANMIGFLNNPSIQTSSENLADMGAAAVAVGRRFTVLNASNGDQIDTAFANAADQHIDALLVGPDPTFTIKPAPSACKFPPIISAAPFAMPAACRAMELTSRRWSGRGAFMSAASSRARSRLIFRSSSRSNSRWC
jgi:putative ABC transport system substrate-binding protein